MTTEQLIYEALQQTPAAIGYHVTQRLRTLYPAKALLEGGDHVFSLNELDGFAGNECILALATTNHPERLDPAIVDRPSRFDRKYPFDLPAVAERQLYIAQWNASLQAALRLSGDAAAQLAERTEGFSFAYLKELFLSAMMRWIATAQPGTMERIIAEQVEVLRAQMASSALLPEVLPGGVHEGMPMPPFGRMHMARAFAYGPVQRESGDIPP